MKAAVLRPGLLVSLKTTITGGVDYSRVDIENDHVDENGARVATWETHRAIPDPGEYERAVVARGKARSLILSVCSHSSFGLLCPTAREQDLQAAIAQARDVTEQFNETAERSQVQVYVLVGRVAQDDAEAALAIAAEVRGLLEDMRAGIAAADPEAIREAANKARTLGAMLTSDAAGQVNAAIEQARKAAREIVKRVEKAGETAADVVAQCNIDRIESARFAFLDLESTGAVESEAPAARGLDLEAAPINPMPSQSALSLEV